MQKSRNSQSTVDQTKKKGIQSLALAPICFRVLNQTRTCYSLVRSRNTFHAAAIRHVSTRPKQPSDRRLEGNFAQGGSILRLADPILWT